MTQTGYILDFNSVKVFAELSDNWIYLHLRKLYEVEVQDQV